MSHPLGKGRTVEVFAVLPCLFAVLGLVSAVLWVLALIDVLQRSDAQFPGAMKGTPSANERLVWILVVLLGNGIGAIVYYFVVMQPYPRQR